MTNLPESPIECGAGPVPDPKWPRSEAELAEPVVAWLEDQDWDVHEEVQVCRGDPIADIVATRNGLIWVVETKRTFGLSVLWQVFGWWHMAHYASTAIPGACSWCGEPRSKRRRPPYYWVGEDFCRRHSLGILSVSPHGVTESLGPRINRKPLGTEILRATLCEAHKTHSRAGACGGGHWTPFRATCEAVAEYVRDHPGCRMKELIDNVPTHYASSATARSALAKWINLGKVNGVQIRSDGQKSRLYPEKANESPREPD